MEYDVAGRLLRTTDPKGNVMTLTYDGLGRKTDMTDPDMGHWHYDYDANGNLISQTDAKGQTITMQYDALNRITLRDLPPAGPGEEDVTYFYDGARPDTCYNCDDHCPSTVDTCDPGTGTCVHTGTSCDAPPLPTPTPTPSPSPSPSPSPTATPTPTPPPVPLAPGNLAAVAVSSSQINLSWTDNSNNETGFKIERSADGGTFTPLVTVAANVTAYNNTGLPASTTYFYRVKATNGAGDSLASNTASATTQSAAPTVPANLAASAVSTSQINLTWSSSSNHTGYILERSLTSSSGFAPIATPAANATSYSDMLLTASTTYYYRIKSTNGTQQSAYSNVASATTLSAPPAAPSSLTATAFSDSFIGITWQDNSTNETGFKIERSLDAITFVQIAVMGQNALSYSDTNLAASTTYYYRVRAFNASGDSAFSNVANARTLASSPPAAPGNLSATAISTSQINLGWQDNSNNESGFVVERYSSGLGTWIQVGWPTANVTTFQMLVCLQELPSRIVSTPLAPAEAQLTQTWPLPRRFPEVIRRPPPATFRRLRCRAQRFALPGRTIATTNGASRLSAIREQGSSTFRLFNRT
jgi:YD repeat-containing protein